MKRLSTAVLAVSFAVLFSLVSTRVPAVASGSSQVAQAAATSPAPDFGNPPSGEVPILFNDHHVYSKPDRLKAGRVLAALVRGKTILVPLRSVFEQMGATVSFDASTKAVDVSKPGADVKVTVGKPEVSINGESRPLDVPPEIYKGSLVVPLRVISEGMGAYVLWVADKRLVVVRYVPVGPPSPPPSPEPTAAPAAPSPTAAPSATPAPVVKHYERFIVGDYLVSPNVYNEFNAGQNDKPSFRANAAFEFPLLNLPWMIEGDFRSFRYTHRGDGLATSQAGCSPNTASSASCVTAIGKQGSAYVPSFDAREDDVDARFALKIADPRIYVGVGYEFRNTNYEGGAFPTQQHGLGFGAEKLPDLDRALSLYGSIYYYPLVRTNGSQNLGDGTFGEVQYRYLKYNVGLSLSLGSSPIFLEGGYLGDRGYVKQNASSDFTHDGPYAGLGIHF